MKHHPNSPSRLGMAPRPTLPAGVDGLLDMLVERLLNDMNTGMPTRWRPLIRKNPAYCYTPHDSADGTALRRPSHRSRT